MSECGERCEARAYALRQVARELADLREQATKLRNALEEILSTEPDMPSHDSAYDTAEQTLEAYDAWDSARDKP